MKQFDKNKKLESINDTQIKKKSVCYSPENSCQAMQQALHQSQALGEQVLGLVTH